MMLPSPVGTALYHFLTYDVVDGIDFNFLVEPDFYLPESPEGGEGFRKGASSFKDFFYGSGFVPGEEVADEEREVFRYGDHVSDSFRRRS
jgi:hypothetical protein